jgi:rod shape-determining protein MreD
VIRRTIAIGAVLVTALLLQTTVFGELNLLGVRPSLVYVVVILIAITEGPSEGAVVGFIGGMLQDFLLNEPKGITALTLTLLGYAMGLARQYVSSPSPLLPTILVAVGTASGVLFHSVVAFLLGRFEHPLVYGVRVVLLTSLYGAILTPLVNPLIRRVVESSRPRRVVRF